MKVALIDNMNNNFFAMTRYFRDLGIDAELYKLINRPSEHFMPESDTFRDVVKLSWINDFPVKIDGENWIFFRKKIIVEEFKKYDIIITCGLSSAFLEKAGLKSDMIIPYGMDLYEKPFKQLKPSFSFDFIKSIIHHSQSQSQSKAYKKARVVISDPSYPLYGNALKKLGIQAYNFGIPMLYNREKVDVQENQKIWGYLDNYDFILFNHSRQYWATNHAFLEDFEKYGGSKRNDKLIRAFAKFVENTKFKKPILVMFEYGKDVDASKKLIEELGIGSFIKWMPTMNRKNIMYGLRKATFSSNAFRENKTDIGGVCYESLASGVPHINNCIEALQDKSHKFYQSPMIHALSEDDILNILNDYENNPNKYLIIKKASKAWFDKNLGIGLAKKYVEFLNLLVNDKRLTNSSPVVKEFLEN